MKTLPLLLATLIGALPALGHAVPVDFPEGAAELTAEALRERISGKVFDVELANGNSWRLEYRSNGYYFVNVSTGFNGSGTWKIDGNRLCNESRQTEPSCNDVRLAGDRIYIKRSSGEVIALQPR